MPKSEGAKRPQTSPTASSQTTRSSKAPKAPRKTKQLAIRVDASTLDAVDSVASALGSTRSEAARRMLVDRVESVASLLARAERTPVYVVSPETSKAIDHAGQWFAKNHAEALSLGRLANQLAKAANRGQHVPEQDVQVLVERVEAMRVALVEVGEQLARTYSSPEDAQARLRGPYARFDAAEHAAPRWRAADGQED